MKNNKPICEWEPSKKVEYELLYDNDFCCDIKKEFPNVIFDHKAADYIHEKRVGITADITYEELYTHAILNGYARLLFGFELLLIDMNEPFLKFVKEKAKLIKDKNDN